MPELDLCLFDLFQWFKLFQTGDSELNEKIREYEERAEKAMAENRVKLFSQYGYEPEFERL